MPVGRFVRICRTACKKKDRTEGHKPKKMITFAA